MIAFAKLGRDGSAQPDDCGPVIKLVTSAKSGLVLIVVKSATSDPGPCSSY
jgi:hypothetical protein